MTSIEEALEVLGKAKAGRASLDCLQKKSWDLNLSLNTYSTLCRKSPEESSNTIAFNNIDAAAVLSPSWKGGVNDLIGTTSNSKIIQNHLKIKSTSQEYGYEPENKSREGHEIVSNDLGPLSSASLPKGQPQIGRYKEKYCARIVVAARVRPLFSCKGERRSHENGKKAVVINGQNVTIWQVPQLPLESCRRRKNRQYTPEKAKRKSFAFDHVFGSKSSQAEVYKTIASPLVKSVIDGVNACLLCYGQTGAGKTYTSFGPEYEDDLFTNKVVRNAILNQKYCEDEFIGHTKNSSSIGIIPRSVHGLFAELKRKREKLKGTLSYTVEITYYQIYLDSHIQDLLDPSNECVQIRHGAKYDYVEGLTVHSVDTVVEVLALLEKGAQNKVIAHTSMNKTSSRSHCIFSVEVIQKVIKDVESFTHKPSHEYEPEFNISHALKSKFTFVDLAGSERACKTQPVGLQLDEAKAINRSLSALGNVVAALGGNEITNELTNLSGFDETIDNSHSWLDNNRNNSVSQFVPWRDSKLTRVLQESLDGNARIALMVNISPNAAVFRETINSLLFGQRAMTITLDPKVNLEVDYNLLCYKLKKELSRAQVQIQEMKQNHENMVHSLTEKLSEKKASFVEMQIAFSENERIIDNLKKQLADKATNEIILRERQQLLEDALLEQLGSNPEKVDNGIDNRASECKSWELNSKRKGKPKLENCASNSTVAEYEDNKAFQDELIMLQNEHLSEKEELIFLNEEKLSKMTVELEKLKSNIECLRRERDMVKKDLLQKEKCLQEEARKAEIKERFLSEKETELEIIKKQNMDMINSSKMCRIEHQKESREKDEAMSSLYSEIDSLLVDKERLHEKLETADVQNEELTNQLEEAKSKFSHISVELENKSNEIELLTMDLIRKDELKHKMAEELKSLQTSKDNISKDLQNQKELNKTHVSEKACIQSLVQELESALNNKQSQIQTLTTELHCVNNTLAEIQQEKFQLLETHKKIRVHLETTENRINEMNEIRKCEKLIYSELLPKYVDLDTAIGNSQHFNLESESHEVKSDVTSPLHLGIREEEEDLGISRDIFSSPSVQKALNKSRKALSKANYALELLELDS